MSQNKKEVVLKITNSGYCDVVFEDDISFERFIQQLEGTDKWLHVTIAGGNITFKDFILKNAIINKDHLVSVSFK